MPSVVIRILIRNDGQPTRVDGQYVVHYDPTLDGDGHYRLDTDDDPIKAKHFPTVVEALEYAREVCPNRREDSSGHLNRPLPCYNLEFKSVSGPAPSERA